MKTLSEEAVVPSSSQLDLRRARDARYVEKLKRRCTLLVGTHCCFCGTTLGLEYAHVVANRISGPGRGRRERYLDILRNPSHYRRMCDPCHDWWDRENERQTLGNGDLPF